MRKYITPALISLSLVAVFVIGIHGEIKAGEFVGLGLFAYALPLAIDTYVVAAIRARRDIAWALGLLAVTIGGGHFLIGATDGDTRRAVRALGDHGSWQQGAMGAAVGVVIVVVLARVHALSESIKVDEAEAEREVVDAERRDREAERAEGERREQAERVRLEHAARLQREHLELEARIERERDERKIAERETAARIEADRIEHERLASEAKARVLAAQATAEREARAAKAAKPKPAVKPEPATGLHAVPSPIAVREDAVKAYAAGDITQEEAARRAGVSSKTIQRDADKLQPKAVNG